MKRAILILPVALLLGCDVTPEWPAVDGRWARYEDHRLAVSLEYPAQCTVDDYPSGALIRYADAPIIAISHVTEAEAKKRGLWAANEPADTCRIAGREGRLYRYRHYDAFFGMHTVSYVVPHKGKWLALELRMKGDTLGPAQQRVIESFAFGAGAKEGS